VQLDTTNMNEILNQIGKLKDKWNSLQPIEQNNQKVLWEKFRLEWNYNSNHIEGNTMTYDETELLLRLGDGFRTKDNSLKDVNEMRAHDTAIFLIRDWAADNDHKVTEKEIRELNQILLVKDFWADAVTSDGKPTRRLIRVGAYKEQPNHVILKSGETFKYAEPDEVPIKMKELVEWYNSIGDEDPITIAAYLHYKFVLIHPFDDGNGRVSRLLMNLHLMKSGFPPLIIKSEDKKNYLYALSEADSGNINAFVEYLAKEMLWSLKISIKGAKGEDITEKDDLFKEIEVWKKELRSELPTNPKRNDKLSLKFYDESITEIYKQIESRIKTFEELFLSSKNTQGFYIDNGPGFFVDPPNSIDGQRTKTADNTITAFQYKSEFIRPLKKPDNLKLKVEIAITFILDVFDYKVIIESDQILTKSYNSVLDEAEIDQIVQKYVVQLFEKIKQVIK
jgi:Fic family protein